MQIDIYQACPCHSGKKIKFCCGKDIVVDLDKILSLAKGKQTIAALESLDRAIEKSGPRDSLLTIKTHLLISLQEYDKAREINDRLLADHPDYPIGHQHAALLLATEGNTLGAVEALQDALEATPKNEVPISMANAFRIVGLLLMSQGDVMASRAHLSFASQLRGDEDEAAGRLVLQTYRSPEIPLQLKHEFMPRPSDHDAPWSKLFTNAIRYAIRGRWREALRRAELLEKDYPDEPSIIEAIAVWNSKLGRRQQSSAAFGRLARLESLPFDERLDAETLCLLLDDQPLTKSLDMVRLVYELNDWQELVEHATANPRLISGTIHSHAFVAEGPPPTAAFLMLDRDEVKSAEGVEFDQFPSVFAETLVYGRQTDRAPRIELYVARSDQFEEICAEFQKLLGQWLVGQPNEETIDQISLLDHMMSFQWHLPRDMPMERRREFVVNQRRNEIMNVWTTIPFLALGDRSPAEVKNDPDQQLTLAALVSIMEQGADAQMNAEFDFDALRETLGMAALPPIDPSEVDMIDISPVRMQRLEFDKLDDEPLMQVYVTCSTIGNFRALRSCAQFVLQRPELEKYIRFESVWMTLAKLTSDTDEALDMMQKARQHASSSGREVGRLLVDELEIRLERGRVESCADLLRTIQANHASDPDVQYQLAAVLQRFDLLDAEGRIAAPPDEASASPEEPTIWTPESGAPSGPIESSTAQKSKLWLPE